MRQSLPISTIGISAFVICIVVGFVTAAALKNPVPLLILSLIGIYLMFSIKVADIVLDFPVRRNEQDPTIAKLEKIWALSRARPGIENLKQDAAIFPFGQVGFLRFINVHDRLAPFGFIEVATQHKKRVIAMMENKWIAPLINFFAVVKRLGKDRIGRRLAPLDQIGIVTDRRPLFGMGLGGLAGGNAGVKDHRFALAIDGAAARPNF